MSIPLFFSVSSAASCEISQTIAQITKETKAGETTRETTTQRRKLAHAITQEMAEKAKMTSACRACLSFLRFCENPPSLCSLCGLL